MSPGDEAPDRPAASRALPVAVTGGAAAATLLLLRLGKRWFAMDVRAIEQVALHGQVTRVPLAPSHILGVIPVRGRLITVVSLEQMLSGVGMVPAADSTTLPRLLIVREGDYEMALEVEEIHGMIEQTAAAGETRARSGDTPDFIVEEFAWQGRLVSLLDARLLVAAVAQLAGISSPWQDASA
jgi:purine-binding chemotaxis protein CheW